MPWTGKFVVASSRTCVRSAQYNYHRVFDPQAGRYRSLEKRRELWESNEMNLLSQISTAFSVRVSPVTVIPPSHPTTHEYIEALHFQGRDWRAITCDEWASYSDAIYAFSPSAFCYFLPGMLSSEV